MEDILTKEIKEVFYNGRKEPYMVYKIPLEKLIYNKYNGRIKSLVKSYEGVNPKLNPMLPKDRLQIERFLYESAEHRNEKTLISLMDYGQQEVGIVTKDYIIIDGNRRASLISKLAREGKIDAYFKAIILPDDMVDNPKEIVRLETNYQMGVDNKVEYKPIEKYLRCKELQLDYSLSIEEIARLMSEKPSKILQWLDILKLMEEYLTYLGSEEIYTRLDRKEGHFVDLYNYLKSNSYKELAIEELKFTYFDYIRLELPVARLRVLGNPRGSLFSNPEYWKSFYHNHRSFFNNRQELTFEEYKASSPEKSNEQVFQDLDYRYKVEMSEELVYNLIEGEVFLKEDKIKRDFLPSLEQILGRVKAIDDSKINIENLESVKSIFNNISSHLNEILNRHV